MYGFYIENIILLPFFDFFYNDDFCKCLTFVQSVCFLNQLPFYFIVDFCDTLAIFM